MKGSLSVETVRQQSSVYRVTIGSTIGSYAALFRWLHTSISYSADVSDQWSADWAATNMYRNNLW